MLLVFGGPYLAGAVCVCWLHLVWCCCWGRWVARVYCCRWCLLVTLSAFVAGVGWWALSAAVVRCHLVVLCTGVVGVGWWPLSAVVVCVVSFGCLCLLLSVVRVGGLCLLFSFVLCRLVAFGCSCRFFVLFAAPL